MFGRRLQCTTNLVCKATREIIWSQQSEILGGLKTMYTGGDWAIRSVLTAELVMSLLLSHIPRVQKAWGQSYVLLLYVYTRGVKKHPWGIIYVYVIGINSASNAGRKGVK